MEHARTSPKSSAKGWAVQALAELIGTAMFLYLAVGAADSVDALSGGANYIGTSLAFGISLLVVSWAFFRISGGHFNPAVSFSSLITGHISIPQFVLYFIAQILGGMVGVALARGTSPSYQVVGQVNTIMNGESIARAFWLEFFLTTILCFVYHMTVHEKNRSTFMAALPYGLTLFACHLFATRYTNAALNPARAFATSIAARRFSREHWIFWFGPLGGAILAAALHILFRYMDYDRYSAGIDAENQAQYLRAQAAVGGSSGGYSGGYGGDYDDHNTGMQHNDGLGGTSGATNTGSHANDSNVLPR